MLSRHAIAYCCLVRRIPVDELEPFFASGDDHSRWSRSSLHDAVRVVEPRDRPPLRTHRRLIAEYAK